jgi:sugar (pentulose or hexulose) kinase
MVWFVTEFPEKAQAISKWVHAADFITGMLSGCWGITDVTNVLKSGYDLNEKTWPPFLYEELPLKKEWLPTVVASGTPIGQLLPALAAELGLSSAVKVVAGMTDGCASQIASGAVNLGEWNTTIGTTLVVKGVTRQQLIDPEDRLYSHLHPEGYWMPGGASNTGADWITKEFKDDLARLNEAAKALIPTNFMAYPLRQEGERFPFVSPQARGFEPEGLSTEERFAANMEGVAYIERYAYEMIEELSGEKVKAVYTAGGGSNSDVWLQIRSNVLNLPIVKMKHVTGAVGAAILAASKTHFTSVIDAAHAMTQVEKEVYPQKNFVAIYKRNYRQFKEQLQEKGYIAKEQFA